MPRPRIYRTNADRQKAYRERKAKAEAVSEPGIARVARRVVAADRGAK
jgi:hypothetical protein